MSAMESGRQLMAARDRCNIVQNGHAIMSKNFCNFFQKVLAKNIANAGTDYMYAAISSNSVDDIKWLINHGYGFTHDIVRSKLTSAAKQYSENCLIYLLSNPSVIDFLDDDTLAKVISYSTTAESVKLLLNQAKDISNVSYGNALASILLRASSSSIYSENNEIIQEFIDHGGNLNSSIYRLPLESAVISGDINSIEYLLNNGADIEKKNPENGQTVLHVTATTSTEVMRLLIECGADLNVLDNNGSTPLMYAVGQKRIPNIKLLLQNGADKNIKDNDGLIAIDIARDTKDEKIISLFE